MMASGIDAVKSYSGVIRVQLTVVMPRRGPRRVPQAAVARRER
jgi:hypothetical protein